MSSTYELSDVNEPTTDELDEEKSAVNKHGGKIVALVILLLLIGMGGALYFILRSHESASDAGTTVTPPEKIVNERAQRLLPCPKTPSMRGDYTKQTCSKQSKCEWTGFNSTLAIPFNCTYKVEEDPWKLSLETNSNKKLMYSLTKGTANLSLQLFCRTNNELRLKISDRSSQRYEVNNDALPITDMETECNSTEYRFVMSEQDRLFNLTYNSVTVLSIPLDGGFVFDEQFLQVTVQLASDSSNYGFGEHNHRSLKLDMDYRTWAIYTRDVAPVHDWNLYGAQPYFMSLSAEHNYVIGSFLKNSNAMDVFLQPDPYPSVTYRVIGGILDFHFFVDSNPESVTQHYTSLVGRSIMPPYWSLGFQLSRWGYQNTSHVREVVDRNVNAGIPLDVVYGDIDYMKHKLDFTYDTTNFDGLPEYVEELMANNTRYIIILDPGIGIAPDKIADLDGGKYKALDDGIAQEIFIRESNGSNLVGEVWPGPVYYPDFTNPNTTDWWKNQISNFYHNPDNVKDAGVRFDALWVDMNEPSAFRNGKEAEAVCDMDNALNSPPYMPENLLGSSLVDKTICMDSIQHWGRHYNVHSLYGHSMAQSTYRALADLFPDKRPFVLTRSTFAGTNRHAIHWLGDNQSQWRQMPWSIVSMLEFSMFGFSMTGSDICGFWFNTTESMCQRWMQLGAFYPFARNHNAGFNSEGKFLHLDQDPANFGDDMIKSSRDILRTRYKLLPYLYTLMYRAHSTGSTVARPLFYEFMDDEETHTIGRQFLWGPALLISPCMEEGSVEVNAYIPEGTWYDYFTGRDVMNTRSWHMLSTPLDKIHLHVRGGYIIPWQFPDVNTHLSKQKPFGLLIALNATEEAQGELYLDDGESADSISSDKYRLVEFNVTSSRLRISSVRDGYSPPPSTLQISAVEVLGVSRRVSGVVIDAGAVTNFTFSQDAKVLKVTIYDTDFTYLQDHAVTWSYT